MKRTVLFLAAITFAFSSVLTSCETEEPNNNGNNNNNSSNNGNGGNENPSIDDTYSVTAVTAFLIEGNLHTSGITLSVASEAFSGKAHIVAFFQNSSGKVIPKGTPIKFEASVNGNPLTFSSGGNSVTTVETELARDVKTDSLFILLNEQSFPISSEAYATMGSNNICLKILQVGKKAYSSAVSGCASFTVTKSAEAAFANKIKAEGNELNIQIPFALEPKSTYFVE